MLFKTNKSNTQNVSSQQLFKKNIYEYYRRCHINPHIPSLVRNRFNISLKVEFTSKESITNSHWFQFLPLLRIIFHLYCFFNHCKNSNPTRSKRRDPQWNLENKYCMRMLTIGETSVFFRVLFSRTACLISIKELRSRFLRIVHVWSLFCLMRLYISLHFLSVLLEN